MHVCILLPSAEFYSPVTGGAIATVTFKHAGELEKRGHRVTVLAMRDENEVYDAGCFVPIDGVLREQLGWLPRKVSAVRRIANGWDVPCYEYYLRSVQRALRMMKPPPEVVVVNNDWVTPFFVKRTLPSVRTVVWLHNEHRSHERHAAARCASADHVIAVSSYIKQWASKQYPEVVDRVSVLLNGVDTDEFFPREDYLAPTSPVRALFIGRIDPNKGPDLAADAVATLRREGHAVSLTVAGGLWFYGHGKEMEDPYFRTLRGKMEAAEAEFKGYVTRPFVPELVRSHDVVFLLARSNDPCPLVTFEALASGCAVVASNRGGLPEICGNAAILVDPDSIDQVVGGLRPLVTDPAALQEYKTRAVERARTLTWSLAAGGLVDILERKVLRRAS